MSFVEVARDGHVATVTLNRPEALNAISGQFADELGGTFLQVAADPGTWVIVLAAAGERAFCVGADLKERNQLDDRGWNLNRVFMKGMFEAIRSVPQPTIASVFGYALGGGCELALSCDLVVASDDALFGLPEVRVGIVPGGGGTQILARRIGVARAKEMVLTGRRISGEVAFEWGLAAKVVEREALANATRDLAEELCRSSPIGVREAKWAIDRGLEVPLQQGMELEELAWRRAVGSDDRREGIAAFNDKRDPQWKNR
ncbi:MAG TPA: enoyl-CoA hydratase-related protein [Actinomycetota bacterium]